jgi:hypothetical protein
MIRFTAEKIFKNPIFTTLTIAVTMFGSGLGVFGKIYSTIRHSAMNVKNMSAYPGDLWMPEMTVWNSICYTPLFIWSYLLILLVYGGIWAGEEKKRFTPFLISSGAIFLIALSHSYDLVPLGFISLLLLVLFRIYKKRWSIELPVFIGYTLYAISLLGSTGYQYYVLKTNPGFAVWASKNINLSPDFIVILMGYGVLSLGYLEGFLYLGGILKERHFFEFKSEDDSSSERSLVDLMMRFLCLWLIIQTLMLYSPFPFARRFVLGIFVPLVIFFIFFIKRITAKGGRVHIITAGVLIVMTFITPAYQVLANTVKVIKGDSRFFYTSEQVDAYSSMDKGLDSSDVVFAAFHESNKLLRFSPAAMLVGSTQQSSEDVQRNVKSLFECRDDVALIPFLNSNRVSYIFLNKKNDAEFIKKYADLLSGLPVRKENHDFIIYTYPER